MGERERESDTAAGAEESEEEGRLEGSPAGNTMKKQEVAAPSAASSTATASSTNTSQDHTPRESIYPMISVERALEIIFEECNAILKARRNCGHASSAARDAVEKAPGPDEVVDPGGRGADHGRSDALTEYLDLCTSPISSLLGRVLSRSIKAPEALPQFDASIMDGYAVVADDISPGIVRKVSGAVDAGASEAVVSEAMVRPGTVSYVATGAPMPPGADAVVPIENTEVVEGGGGGGEVIRITRGGVVPGQWVRPAGSDVTKGDVVLSAGTVLGPSEIG